MALLKVICWALVFIIRIAHLVQKNPVKYDSNTLRNKLMYNHAHYA